MQYPIWDNVYTRNRLILMNNFYSILVALSICLVSCLGKSYDELLVENNLLKKQVEQEIFEVEKKYSVLHAILLKKIKDSLALNLYGSNNDSIIFSWSDKSVYCEKKFARLNEIYNNKESFYLIEPYSYDTVVYSFPSLDPTKKEMKTTLNKSFSFIPKSTGFFYWTGEFKIINKRIGKVNTYLLSDSILILNNQ